MKQQKDNQNLWLLWLETLRDQLAWMHLDMEADPEEIRCIQELIYLIYPLIGTGGKETS